MNQTLSRSSTKTLASQAKTSVEEERSWIKVIWEVEPERVVKSEV